MLVFQDWPTLENDTVFEIPQEKEFQLQDLFYGRCFLDNNRSNP